MDLRHGRKGELLVVVLLLLLVVALERAHHLAVLDRAAATAKRRASTRMSVCYQLRAWMCRVLMWRRGGQTARGKRRGGQAARGESGEGGQTARGASEGESDEGGQAATGASGEGGKRRVWQAAKGAVGVLVIELIEELLDINGSCIREDMIQPTRKLHARTQTQQASDQRA